MATRDKNYPGHLNPFGDDEEAEGETTRGDASDVNQSHPRRKHQNNRIIKREKEDYPDYLSPFGEEEEEEDGDNLYSSERIEDYDDSLNPFGEEEAIEGKDNQESIANNVTSINNNNSSLEPRGAGNPFSEDDECNQEDKFETPNDEVGTKSLDAISNTVSSNSLPPKPIPPPVQPDSLEPPPVPLPRTKSLLKKEQAQRNRQKQVIQDLNQNNTTNSILSTTSSTSSSSLTITTTSNTTTASGNSSSTGSFQRKKNKRNAPPVPINFKRQVSGSLDAIEAELNEIGDMLALIEKESNQCQSDLKAAYQVDEEEFTTTKCKFVELVKRKNIILERQKELMYKKRELKLDQIHSDIEFELRMIGNKQLSHRTAEDELREKELLKKLVEIVEEKSDIVENLNKDTFSDNHDIEEAFRRLNIANGSSAEDSTVEKSKNSAKIPIDNENCDKPSSVALGTKFSKIATLLPKGGNIKSTMKIKSKRLFKKTRSRSIER